MIGAIKRRNDVTRLSVSEPSKFLTVNDLNYKIQKFGGRFLIFALIFYLSVPLLYYYLYLKWSLVDSFFVSNLYFLFCVFNDVGLLVLCGKLFISWIRNNWSQHKERTIDHSFLPDCWSWSDGQSTVNICCL